MRNAVVMSTLAIAGLAGVITAARKHHRITVTGFSVSPATFAATSPGRAGGTTIRFRISAPARVTIAIDRRIAGRPFGRRYVAVGSIDRIVGHGGRVAIAFSGRIGGRALRPGAYRATLSAVGRQGSGSGRKRVVFTIVGTSPSQPGAFPGPSTTGTPPGWKPRTITSSDVHIVRAGAIVQNLQLLNGADLYIDAPNVTVKNVDVQGGSIRNCDNWFGGHAPCEPGLLVEDTTIELAAGQSADPTAEPAIWLGNYRALRVKVWRRSAGFYVGNKSGGAGPVQIDDSYVNLIDPNNTDSDPLHSEALQCYDGPAVTLHNDTFDTTDASHGTSSFFCPSGQGNTSANVDGLLAMNGSNDPRSSNYNCCGWLFRDGVPGSVTNLYIVRHTWGYGPIDVACSLITTWRARIVTINRISGGTSSAPYNITRVVRPQRCNTQGGG